MKKFTLEVCVDSYQSALNAFNAGADRLELCSNLIIGGTTPSTELFKKIKQNLNIKINILIRPRFGDFLYTNDEFEIIKNEIINFKKLGADGIVFGALKKDGSLDIPKLQEVLNISQNMYFTLHRAFDVCQNPFKALEQCIDLKIDSILTSGQENTCVLGKNLIKQLVDKANNKIDILVGSGVSPLNIKEIANYTNAKSFHLSGKIEKDSHMIYRNNNVNMGIKGLSEYTIWETDEFNIKNAKQILNDLERVKNYG